VSQPASPFTDRRAGHAVADPRGNAPSSRPLVQDARNAGRDDIASFFESVMTEDSSRAQKCHVFQRVLPLLGRSVSDGPRLLTPANPG